MLSNLFKKYIITPIEEEAVNEGLKKIKKKFNDIQKETIYISIFVLTMMTIFPLIFSQTIAKFFTSILLWGILSYSLYHSYKNRQDILYFLKVRSLEKFIYQKIYNEVKKEISTELKEKSTVENIIFTVLAESQSLLAHKISINIHKMSQKIIIYNIIILLSIIVTYSIIRSYLASYNYHLNILELMLFN